MGFEYLIIFRSRIINELGPNMTSLQSFDSMWEGFLENGEIDVYVVTWDAHFLF